MCDDLKPGESQKELEGLIDHRERAGDLIHRQMD